jgi:hypothetical protein
MEFNKELFEKYLAKMDRNRSHDRYVEMIKNQENSIEYRAAVCVVDSGSSIGKSWKWCWDEYCSAFKRFSDWPDDDLRKCRIFNKQSLPENRIAAANELHRREQEEEDQKVKFNSGKTYVCDDEMSQTVDFEGYAEIQKDKR